MWLWLALRCAQLAGRPPGPVGGALARRHGYGRALWRAAMNWGHHHGADYQLLQAEVGGASDRLCQTEGLTSLGFVCTRTL